MASSERIGLAEEVGEGLGVTVGLGLGEIEGEGLGEGAPLPKAKTIEQMQKNISDKYLIYPKSFQKE